MLRETSAVLIFALLAILMEACSQAAAAQQATRAFQLQQPSTSQLDAQLVNSTNSITIDSDVKNLVITIPDNATTNQSSSWGFLPANATVVGGTTVIWLNADVNMTHRIIIANAETGKAVSNSSQIPYQNTTIFTFTQTGQYTVSDPSIKANSTINVVNRTDNDPLTNSSAPTVGVFVVPASGKSSFDEHINKLGFNAVSTTSEFQATNITPRNAFITAKQGGNMLLYVWTQQASDPDAVSSRLASKVRILEGILYPDDTVKQNMTAAH
jgi:plastocyanin